MELQILKAMVAWCNTGLNDDETAQNCATFWRRWFFSAYAFDVRTRLLLQAFVAQFGVLPDEVRGTIPG